MSTPVSLLAYAWSIVTLFVMVAKVAFDLALIWLLAPIWEAIDFGCEMVADPVVDRLQGRFAGLITVFIAGVILAVCFGVFVKAIDVMGYGPAFLILLLIGSRSAWKEFGLPIALFVGCFAVFHIQGTQDAIVYAGMITVVVSTVWKICQRDFWEDR